MKYIQTDDEQVLIDDVTTPKRDEPELVVDIEGQNSGGLLFAADVS